GPGVAAAGDAGIGETAVDTAEALQRLGEAGLDRRLVADIDLERRGFHAVLPDRRLGLGILRRVGAPDADLGASRRHGFCHAEPDAAVAAGDQRDLARQVERLVRHDSPLNIIQDHEDTETERWQAAQPASVSLYLCGSFSFLLAGGDVDAVP